MAEKGKYSYLDFAEDVLMGVKDPMIYQDIWSVGVTNEYDKKFSTQLKAKRPWNSLGAYLFTDANDNKESKFIKVGKNPARFWLKERETELSKDVEKELDIKELEQEPTVGDKNYHERDLYPILSYFAYANPEFNKEKPIYTKTIAHEKGSKDGYNQWVHPDVVGFYMPIEDWNDKLLEFNNISDRNSVTLYSFEVKKNIDKSNYRACFFQAVSNSSWANEGYLVATEIRQDDDLLSELERLSASFGIGIIQLDLEDIDSSRVLFAANHKKNLDWELMNKLCEKNLDFESFIDDVVKAHKIQRIDKTRYNPVNSEDIGNYIAKLKKSESRLIDSTASNTSSRVSHKRPK